MKRFFTLLLSIIVVAQAYAWKPLMVGHRGSGLGVENTKEAFINGVEKLGYDGLECDVRVTSDRVYVISHDETTNRVGGSLTVASATFAQLQAENYTQTRSGVTYTGKICTVEEYLDICNEKNVFPVLELKWTTGINNNDMSNFPGLMDLVKKKGLESKVVFLTSMQNSLLYIRKNYPDAKCQFLCTELGETKIDWCKENGLEPSISVGYFGQQLILKYHLNGMNTACWTVNSAANYKKYAEMGIYMMTSDYLNKNEMPELEEFDWDNIPVANEPLTLSITKVWTRTMAEENLPVNFPDGTSETYKTGQQAAFRNGEFWISDYGTSKVLILDKDSTEPRVIDGYPMHGITTDDANNLIQRGEAGYYSKPSTVYITKLGETTPVKIEFSIPSSDNGQANFVSASGDVFSEKGGYVYVYPNAQTIVYAVHIANGEFKELITYPDLSIAASTAGVVIPYGGGDNPDKFIYMVRNQGFYRYAKGDKGAILTGASTTAPSRNSSQGGAFFTLEGHEILVHPSGKNYCGGFSLKDVSADNADLGTVAELGAATRASNKNASVGTFFKAEVVDEYTCDLYFYTMAYGYGLYRISSKPSSVEPVFDASEKAVVYPNPISDQMNIKSREAITSVTVYSILGEKVASVEGVSSNSLTINCGGLAPGVYLVKVNDSDEIHRVIKK